MTARTVTGGILALVAAVAAAAAVGVVSVRSTTGSGDTAPTTTAPLRVQRAEHRPGDCVRWEQGATPVTERSVTTVPCDEPHLVEITGRVVIEDPPGGWDRVPTYDELDELTDRLCLPVNESHLGGPLDPHGRYYSAGIQPSPESWRAGDREAWCGLGARDGTEDTAGAGAGEHRPFRGRVSAAAQFWRYERGECLRTGTRAPVPCAGEHEVEVVARVDLPDDHRPPPAGDGAGWEALLGSTCRDHARSHLGRDLVAPLSFGWLPIEDGSWDAGQRSAHCVVGEQEPVTRGWVTVTRSAREVPS